jgi:DNA-binding response OmpR family regulator
MTRPYALILEDDPKLGTIFCTALQQAGYDTDLDENGNRYRSFLNEREPDFVILDLHLPFAFGGDILNEIRSKHPETVVAVVTADLVRAKTLTGKADHILIKPVSVASLLRLAESIKKGEA